MKRIITSILTLCICSLMLAKDQPQYIIHSSGNVLGKGSENRAVILKNDDANLKPLRLAKQSDGSYIIALDVTPTLYLSLGTANGWSTYFVTDSLDARAHYTMEEAGSYVKFKNKQTNGYLGTDDSAVGAYVYSDKNGSDTKHKWMLSDKPVKEIKVLTHTYPISAISYRQRVEGWGVSLCWWANMCGKWSDEKIDELIDWMVSPEGLNWNIFRYNIGGGDDPNWTNCTPHHMGNGKGLRAEMEGFQDERGGEFHWDRDAAQRKIMLKIREKRPDAIFEAFSNSCPWWMTESGCCSGNGDGGKDNLKPEYYEDFANYLVEVCKHYKEQYGIEFKTLEPFNESVTGFWYMSGVQEGCHFDYASQVKFVKVLEPILKKSGLKTVISAADETNIGLAVEGIRQFEKNDAMSLVSQWNTHTYSGDNRNRSQFGSLARAAQKTVWMSETGSGGSGIGGNLSMAKRLFDDIRYIAPEAWIDWQYMEEANDQWCFVRGKFADQTFYKVKNYYVRQQITKFIKKGYYFVDSNNEQSIAAVSPKGDSLFVVLLNNDVQTVHRIQLMVASVNGDIRAWRTSETEDVKEVKDFKTLENNEIEVSLPELSITTIVVPIKDTVEDDCDEMPQFAFEWERHFIGYKYIIVPQSNANVAVAATATGMSLAPVDVTATEQMWEINFDAMNGGWQFMNGNGKYATAPQSYAMYLNTKSKYGTMQCFDMIPIDRIHHRITVLKDKNLRSWDLEGQNLNAGTTVGTYAYGSSVDADTRNWRIIPVYPIYNFDEPDAIENVKTSDAKEEEYYSVSGVKLNGAQKGINIVRQSDGKVVKIKL